MNCLNSILIEGFVDDIAPYDNVNNKMLFNLLSIGNYKNHNKMIEERTYVVIETKDALAQSMNKEIEKGIKLRVIGRIKSNPEIDKFGNAIGGLIVYAEHIEIIKIKESNYVLSEQS